MKDSAPHSTLRRWLGQLGLTSLCCIALGSACLAQDAPETPPQGLAFYGQINRAFQYYDDGQQTYKNFFIDNSKSVSRIGATYDQPLDNGWQMQFRGELGLTWDETNEVGQPDPPPGAFTFNREVLRKLEMSFGHPVYGTFFIGQGAMASDGITGQDLSLTTVVAGAAVKDMAGGMYFRTTAGDLTTFRIQDRFRTLGSSRRLRLRYDTPIRNNLSFSAAVGKEVLNEDDGRNYADIAVRYDNSPGDFRIKAGAALRWAGGYDQTKFQKEQISFIASGSVLHKPSRLNLTGAYGVSKEGDYYAYGKLGRRWYDFLPYGWTAVSLDYYYTDEQSFSNGEGSSVGFAVVQQFKEQNMHLYAAIRNYKYDDDDADYEDSLAILTGIRWQF